MDSTHSFGYWVRRRRRALDLTQGSLARQVGCALSMIRKIEADERRPSLQLAERLAVSLAVPAAERSAFLKAARAERAVDSLDLSTYPVGTSAAPMPRHNLPAQVTSLIGREQEIATLTARLTEGDTRLVTLAGPGGIGKTRLAISAAAELHNTFPDGVWFVELPPISDPALVPQAVASTLGLRDEPGQSMLAWLAEYVRTREALLILDNCEHLVEASAQLAESVLHAGPQMRILATSREALRIPGEVVLTVPPLSTPEAQPTLSVDDLLAYESVRLFLDRSAAALPGFAITAANAPAIADLCRVLAGIPLAIELAAARVGMLRVEEIAGRLADMFHVLTGGSRTALPRQQTLQATMDWSYDLLTDKERVLLRRLSVFAGGWTLESAEQVAGDLVTGESSDSPQPFLDCRDVLDALTGLVSKSLVLVVREQGKETTYRLLEPIRQYAREKLQMASEEKQLRDRHLDYYAETAIRAEQFTGAEQIAWLRRLEVEIDNVLAALDWAAQHNVPAGCRLASAVWQFCLDYGYLRALADRLTRLLAHPTAASRNSGRASALVAIAQVVAWQDMERAKALAEEGLAIYREIGDRRGEAACLLALGPLVSCMVNGTAGRALLMESLALYRSLNDARGIASALMHVASSGASGEYTQTRAYLEEALVIYRQCDDVPGTVAALSGLAFLEIFHGNLRRARAIMDDSLAMQRRLGEPLPAGVLHDLGRLAMEEGNYALARTYLEECLAKWQAAGDTIMANWACVELGYVALRAGELDRATTFLTTAMHRFHETGAKIGVVFAVEGLASLAAQRSEPEQAARLFAWADQARESMSDSRPPVEQRYVNHDLASIRTQLGAAAFATAWADGSAMTVEQAMATAVPESPVAPWSG